MGRSENSKGGFHTGEMKQWEIAMVAATAMDLKQDVRYEHF